MKLASSISPSSIIKDEFDPSSESTIKAFYKFKSLGGSDIAQVSSWTDQTGNFNMSHSGAEGESPSYTSTDGAVTFNGSNQKLQSSSDGNTLRDDPMNCGGASTVTGGTIGTAANSDAVNTGSPVTPFTGYFRVMYDDGYHGDQYAGAGRLIISGYGFTTSASGSFEGNTITASSTNNMGAVLTYQDHAGVNALNTDIILKLSADNGSNYSTATLTALPDFSTGIKMCKANDVSVTAGTQLKYKIEFANQSGGSKEAIIRGVSLQY